MISYYEFETGCGRVKNDAYKKWASFAYDKVLYWGRFTLKWVINAKGENLYHLSYEDLMQNPAGKLREIIKFINPSKLINNELISRIVRENNLAIRRNISSFKYYNPVFFERLEHLCYEQLVALGYKPRYQLPELTYFHKRIINVAYRLRNFLLIRLQIRGQNTKSIDKNKEEIMTGKASERITRLIDHDEDSSMENKKREGYF